MSYRVIARCITVMAALWLASVLGLPIAPPAELRAQTQLVDHIAAIVGDTIILRTELEEEILDMEAQQVSVPPPNSPQRAAFVRQVLERMVADLLIIVA
ncbi:MAG TPA: hypothetical protein VLC48_02330, partial [Gemmatimonadota bacterium]|nr:hypothetical protein [Gemmatimonadota bacterium]